MTKSTTNARECALRVLLGVFDNGLSLDHALAQHLPGLSEPRDRAFAQQLAYGVLRYHTALDDLAGQLLRKPLADKHLDLCLCIWLGLEQLWHLQSPPHAVIHATVELARLRKKNWATGMLNAVLRRFQREQVQLVAALSKQPDLRYACPEWLLQRMRNDWPDNWMEIAAAALQQPPMWLRVNLSKISRTAYLAELAEQEITAQSGTGIADICLQQACPVQQLPGFADGLVSVQDSAAQCAVPLLELAVGQNVLDACAAPGGKTTQILESQIELSCLTAIDIKPARMVKIHENLNRLQLDCKLITANAIDLETWWDGNYYDRILLDAPCSASGVIRRHPDIKQRLQSKDIERLGKLQQQLLTKLWSALCPGGMLVYVTCSIFSEENQQVVSDFLATHPDARLAPFSMPIGQQIDPGWQILPGPDNTDGLFFARLQKID